MLLVLKVILSLYAVMFTITLGALSYFNGIQREENEKEISLRWALIFSLAWPLFWYKVYNH